MAQGVEPSSSEGSQGGAPASAEVTTPSDAPTQLQGSAPPTAAFEESSAADGSSLSPDNMASPSSPSTAPLTAPATSGAQTDLSAPPVTAAPSAAPAASPHWSDTFESMRPAFDGPRPLAPFEFRHVEMPGDYVARPVTLPEGTFELTLNNYLAFVDASEVVGWVPSFALGITDSFELGLSAPLRYNETLEEWTKLDPLVHVAQQWLDTPELEGALRAAVLVPLTSESDVQLELGLPFMWHASSLLRVDMGVTAVIALEDKTQAAVNVPLALSVQPTRWLFTGVFATPNLGVTSKRAFGVDAGMQLGFTLQARGSAQVDLLATLFAENVGTGSNGKTTDGIGTALTARFYPEIY